MANSPACPRVAHGAAASEAKPLVAQVKPYTGTPTLLLDGEPAFAGMCC